MSNFNINKFNIDKEILKLKDEFIEIFRDFHKRPGLSFEEQEMALKIAKLLKEYGYEVHTNIGKTGVVGVLKKGNGVKSIMLRADMDALPLKEKSGLDYASCIDEKMHACGHDGHSTTLLLAAKILAKREFDGTLVLIFQPAEEIGLGAPAMIEDGLFEKFPVDYVFAYHNIPNLGDGVGTFYCKSGAMMASVDDINVRVVGVGGHGSKPHKAKDSILCACAMIMSLQHLISRQINAQNPAVLSCGMINSGHTNNIIPDECEFKLSLRTLDESVREFALKQIKTICEGTAKAYGVEVFIEVANPGDVTFNDKDAANLALTAAREVFGENEVVDEFLPSMGSEDFGAFSKYAKTAYCFIQNGSGFATHHPEYKFNDDLIILGAAWFDRLVQNYLKD